MKSRRIHKRTRHAKRTKKYAKRTRFAKRTKRHTKRHTKRTKKYARRMRGGNGMRPFVGAPYNAGDAHPQGNYYAYNENVKAAPDQSNALLEDRSMMGLVRAGGGRGKRSGSMRGGGLSHFMSSILPEEAINVGRSVPSAIGHAYDKFTGVLSTPSSMVYPTQQPLVGAQDEGISRMPPPTNIMKLYETANNTVAAM